jgi:hypothetical protein
MASIDQSEADLVKAGMTARIHKSDGWLLLDRVDIHGEKNKREQQ